MLAKLERESVENQPRSGAPCRRACYGALLVAAAALTSGLARAECLSLVSGPVVLDVKGCKLIEPEQTFDYGKERFAWIKDLDPAGKKQLLDSYRGLYLKGKVVKSTAVAQGLTGETAALTGQDIYAYMPPSPNACTAVNGKRLAASVKEVCCDGGGQVPCLLGTSYLLLKVQLLGTAGSGAGDAVRQKASHSKDYQAAETAFKEHKWKIAAAAYEKARTNGELDVKGYYELGYAYRELDQCGDAVRHLKVINERANQKQIWGDEEGTARKATFLLARCYAKMNDPGASVLVLQSFLLEPEKYRAEIKESLHHKDFGWIHTSKEYLVYKKDANKKLGGLKK